MQDPVDDNRNYNKYGLYFNRSDNRVIVPKKMRSLGFTVNFARKETYVFPGGVLIILLLVFS
jgi:uncharacterized membrane protein